MEVRHSKEVERAAGGGTTGHSFEGGGPSERGESKAVKKKRCSNWVRWEETTVEGVRHGRGQLRKEISVGNSPGTGESTRVIRNRGLEKTETKAQVRNNRSGSNASVTKKEAPQRALVGAGRKQAPAKKQAECQPGL